MSTSRVFADQSTIAVAIDKGKSSQAALKWAVEELLAPGQTITLVHVRDTYTMEADLTTFFRNGLEAELSMVFPQGEGGWNPGAAVKVEIEKQTKAKLEPFHAFCKRRNVESKEEVLDEKDVPKAISEYIAFTEIPTLVIGGGSRTGLFRKFRDPDTANKVIAATPEFCTVYVISKGKVKSMRNGTIPPLSSEHAAGSTKSFSDFSEVGNDIRNQSNSLQTSISGGSDFSGTSSKISGFTSMPSSSGNMGDFSGGMSSLSDISFTSSGTIKRPNYGPQLDFSSLSNCSGYSDWSYNSIGSSSFYAESDILSQSNPEMMEAELRKLRLELKQKVESYNAACNGTLPAPPQNLEGQISDTNDHWKLMEEEGFTNNDKTNTSEGNSVATLDNDKYGAGMLAEIEAQKRRIAMIKAEEKMQLLPKPGHSY